MSRRRLNVRTSVREPQRTQISGRTPSRSNPIISGRIPSGRTPTRTQITGKVPEN